MAATIAAAAVAVGAMGALAGCSGNDEQVAAVEPTAPAPDASGPTSTPSATTTGAPPGSVVIVGDSLTVAATAQLDAALTAAGVEVIAIDAVEGRRMVSGDIPPGLAAVDRLLDDPDAAGADVWVVALGTNDVGGRIDPDRATADAADLVDRVPVGARVVWVNVWIRDRAGDAALFNQVVSGVVESRPRTHIVDWYSRGADTALFVGDGIHLTDQGEQAFAAAITESVLAGGG